MMADNGVKDFDSLKATPGMEFWRLYEILQKKLENKNNKTNKAK
ncbi:hypothetical protein [Sphingobacterium mizutaii]|nr:hypothetical protein [Sphingobacterium mizutaii]